MAQPKTLPEKPGRIRLKSVEFVTWAQLAGNQVERLTSESKIKNKKIEIFLEGGFVVFDDYLIPLSNVKSIERA